MSAVITSEKMCKLIASDKSVLDCSVKAARKSKIIDTMIIDLGLEQEESEKWDPIPLLNVDPKILALIIKFMEHHKNDVDLVEEDSEHPKQIGEWDEEFLNLSQDDLFNLVTAANFLDVYSLLDVATQKIANLVDGKTTDDMRQIFNIPDDFTDGETENWKHEKTWFEDV